MRKIGVLGGSFDPVHIGHITIAEAALEQLALDFVILIPAAHSPFKEHNGTEDKHRLEMLRLAVSEKSNLVLSDYEIKKGGKSYTYETAEYLKGIYPDDKLFFILGDDAYRDFYKWKNPDKIAACFDFAVATRDGDSVLGNVRHIDIAPVRVSSSEIRRRLRSGISCRGLLTDSVLSYIEKNHLYKE